MVQVAAHARQRGRTRDHLARALFGGNGPVALNGLGLSLEGQDYFVATIEEAEKATPRMLLDDGEGNELSLRRRVRIIATLLPGDEQLPHRVHAMLANSGLEVHEIASMLEGNRHDVPLPALRQVAAMLLAGGSREAVSRATGVSPSLVGKVSAFLAVRSGARERCEAVAYEFAHAEHRFQAWRRRTGCPDGSQARQAWAEELGRVHATISDEEQAVIEQSAARTLEALMGRSRSAVLLYLRQAERDVEAVEGVLA